MQCIDSRRREGEVPARGRFRGWRTGDVGRGNPSVMLQGDGIGRKVIVVGNGSSAQKKLLRGAEGSGSGD